MADKTLKKHLKLPAVFAFGIGPMLSSGIFLLPGMVYAKVGPAAILAYFVAGLLIIPSLLSKAELATAMPKAGGTYYFIDRSLGPMFGTIAGVGTWLALSFKSAFDLIGLGAYLVLFLELPVKPVALALAVGFGSLSITGVKHVGRLQGLLVTVLLGFLAFFIGKGIFHTETSHFLPFLSKGTDSFLGAIGFVYVGFTGLTKVASMAEEVDNPERVIPLGMLLSLGVTLLIYILGIIVIVGVLPGDVLSHTLTPVAETSKHFLGNAGVILMSIAALIAFSASANAGLTAASRYPLAMSRDRLAPGFLNRIGKFHTPTNSILMTTGLMIFFILILSPEGIAKLASAFQLMLFGLINLAVIVMRESKIESYDPGFRSIFYPWLQIIGIFTTLILIPELGMLPVIVSGLIVLVSILWYVFYGTKHVKRSGAMIQVFERLGKAANPQLDQELRGILREKGLRKEDSLEQSIFRSSILQHQRGETYVDILHRASQELAAKVDIPEQEIFEELSRTNQMGDTPVGKHIALPHARLENIRSHELVIVHSADGVQINQSDETIYALFILIGPQDDPRQHLRFLAELANRAEELDFSSQEWRDLDEVVEIRAQFIRSGEVAEVTIDSPGVVGRKIREVQMHHNCLIAFIDRKGEMVVPHGDTVLEKDDTLTIIGTEDAVNETIEVFGKK